MGFTDDSSPEGGPLFNNTPQTTADFERLRRYVEERGNGRKGTSAERNALPPAKMVAGQLWSETDTKTIWFCTGSGWVFVAAPGGFRLEFTSSAPFADAVVRYPQWTADSGNSIDPFGSTVVPWNNGASNPSGLQFNGLGTYAVQGVLVLPTNVASGASAVFQAQTGALIEAVGTSPAGNQNLSFSIPNYRVTSVGQKLSILFVKTNGDATGANQLRMRLNKIG